MGQIKVGRRWGLAAVMALGAALAAAQTVVVHGNLQPEVSSGDIIVREQTDLFTGQRWRLVHDPGSGAPGHWIYLGDDGRRPQTEGVETGQKRPAPLVRAGQRLIVERHTPVIDVVLEAVALSNAAAGERVTVRLTLGGHLASARVLDKGHAELEVTEGAGS